MLNTGFTLDEICIIMSPHVYVMPCRDLLSPNGDPNLKVTRRYKRRLEENNHVVAVCFRLNVKGRQRLYRQYSYGMRSHAS